MLTVEVRKMARPLGELHMYEDTLRENLSLAVYNVGYQRCPPGHRVGKHPRDHYLVHYVTSGKGIFYSGDTAYHLGEGDMFFIFPGYDVCYEADKTTPWNYYWVAFNGTDAHRILNCTGFSPEHPVLKLDDADVLRNLLVNIYRVRGKTPAADTAMTGHLHLFLSELMSRTGEVQETDDTQDYLIHAVEYIREHYASDIRVEEIASKVGVSRSQLYRAFTQEFGMSPHRYLKQYRINEACALLHRSELSVGAVAVAVGFSDPLYFSRVFREVKGISPSQYKQGNRN